eukprot:TRINITY_DN7385_c0_g1_i1.p1 TRINITY_DN7385_c0_g1~~TRINITY_DN7385_c0_g1_i1.p1  ORF type:complete len:592 (+),score=111.02 TRINITY_DN7385_c0_g1_i1:102-1778(+)
MARFEGSTVMTSLDERRRELETRYVPVPVKRFPRRVMGETAEEKWWRGFKKKTNITAEFRSRISCIDFCQADQKCAVTGQGKVTVFDSKTHEVIKAWHPPDTIYCTRWRADGKLLVSSGEKTTIKIWNIGTMKMIRELQSDLSTDTGHKRAIHSVCFLPDKQSIISGSDDNTAIVWDVPTQKQLIRLTGHEDYVRTTAVHPYNKNIVATASYDRGVKVWDLRISGTEPTQVFTASDAVSSLAFHPAGTFLASGSGTDVAIWDIEAGSAVATLQNHTKDVQCVTFNNFGSRLLSASVDRQVKVYETETYSAVHTMTYPEPVYSVGISHDSTCYAAGTLEGKIYLRSRDPNTQADDQLSDEEIDEFPKELEMYSGLGDLTVQRKKNWNKPNAKTDEVEGEYKVMQEPERMRRLKRYDVKFRKFNYQGALNDVLNEKRSNRDRHALFYTVISELQRRNGLRIALSGRDSTTLVLILSYIKDGIVDPRFSTLLTTTLDLILEIYHTVLHESPVIVSMMNGIRRKVMSQVAFLAELQQVSGSLSSLSRQCKIQRMMKERVAKE